MFVAVACLASVGLTEFPVLTLSVGNATPKFDYSHRNPWLDWSPDGRWFVTADPGWHGTFDACPPVLALWDARTGKRVGAFAPDDPWSISTALFVGNGSTLAVSGFDPAEVRAARAKDISAPQYSVRLALLSVPDLKLVQARS